MSEEQDRAARVARAQEIAARRQALEAAEPGLRARDVADRLGVGEGELVAARVGEGATRLAAAPEELVEALPALGRVMVLTRNETAVHERKGVFGNVRTGGHVGLVLNGAIDLRLFFKHWRHLFAVEETVKSGRRTSLQVFDAAGVAVHKIYLLEESDRAVFDRLVARFRAADQDPGLDVRPVAAPATVDPATVDAAAFRRDWAALSDVHEFHGLLRRYGLARLDALRLADPAFVAPAPADGLLRALEKAAARELPIMVFVGNRGCIQIHSGPVQSVRAVGSWDNVLDPDFNLHVRRDRLARAFVVRKPTDDGIVTALELFDVDGIQVLQMFGVRERGERERDDWRALADEIAGGSEEIPA